jgi:hypothetical protein
MYYDALFIILIVLLSLGLSGFSKTETALTSLSSLKQTFVNIREKQLYWNLWLQNPKSFSINLLEIR